MVQIIHNFLNGFSREKKKLSKDYTVKNRVGPDLTYFNFNLKLVFNGLKFARILKIS